MLGCYDFCGHYEWTFAWLERTGGKQLLHDYWEQAISVDSQRHARALIVPHGFDGMAKYWGHTLAEESPDQGFAIARTNEVFRIDMTDCPSKGFLLRNGLEQHRDYCDHCMGWVGPMLHDAGFVADHEHNHRGLCWWEIRPAGSAAAPSPVGTIGGKHDVRGFPGWTGPDTVIDRYLRAGRADDKLPP